MPNVRIFRKGFWQIITICFAVFLFSAGMRLIEYPRWDQSSFKVDGEWLLATHDAYFWVAGAEDVNPIAEPMPMAIMLDVLSRIFPIPIANLAFWASILLAALVAIPLALWGYFLGAPVCSDKITTAQNARRPGEPGSQQLSGDPNQIRRIHKR